MDKKLLRLTILFLAGVLLSACGISLIPNPTLVAATATLTPPPLPTDTPTAVPTDIPTLEPTATNPPTPAAGALQVNPTDHMEMVYVPAGDFLMGSARGTEDEQPEHTVQVAAFWIDKTEVTNEMYSRCVQAGACPKPSGRSNTHANYDINPKYAGYPVVGVKWGYADAYCKWAGQRLPTEAEWEKAARGTNARTYPWGDALPNSNLLNFNNPAGDAVHVGSYPLGASPYGVLDMAGNVREWVSDWYDANYYVYSPDTNPTGPVTGKYKVLRGSSWHSSLYLIRSADRAYLAPDAQDVTVGFRCVLPAR